MPDLATTGSAVKILRWLIKPGEAITRGQFLLEVETDKAAMEVESTVSGILQETRAEEGAEIDAGTVIAVIVTETASSPAPAPTANKPTIEEAKAEPAASPVSSIPKKGGLFARNRASSGKPDQNGGPAPEKAPRESRELSVARRTAARRLQESKQTIPHFYLQTSVNAEPMTAARKAALPLKLVWDAFFVKAVSQAVQRFDQLTYRYVNEQLVPQKTDAIGVAVDIEGDLYVIAVEEPGQKSVAEISQHIRARVDALKSGDPAAKAVRPAIMSVTNLGGSNVESFTAIVNPPESAILAVGKIRPVVTAVSATESVIQHRANLTLSVDHRVVNGKYAADFLGAVVEELEKL